MPAVEALIFDYDGLMVDSETPEYQTWLEVYRSYGMDLPLTTWAQIIGRGWDEGEQVFDPHSYLERMVDHPINREAIRAQRQARYAQLTADQSALPGVVELIAKAKASGMKLGIASSSETAWVRSGLLRLRLLESFDTLQCAEMVERAKPDPALYVAALEALGVPASQAIALEDSPNGALAAVRAGIFCVVVPNAMTRALDFDHADLRLESLADISLDDLMRLRNER